MNQRRILVIDDNPSVLSSIRQVLEAAGFEVEAAANGREGIRRFEAAPPDLVITDIIMPECEGIEVIREIRGDRPMQPILAISGSRSRGHIDYLRMAECLGANAVLAKPFAAAELLAKVEACLASLAG
jgi:CheY-like chemotaxis protein